MIVSAILVSGTLLWHARTNRYQFHIPANGVIWKMDTTTGLITDAQVDSAGVVDPLDSIPNGN